MIGIQGAENFLRHKIHLLLANRFDTLYIHDGEYWVAVHIGVAQRDTAACFNTAFIGEIHYRYGPKQAVRRMQFFCNAE